MITIFNRRQLLVTFQMKTQTRMREMLADHHIEYTVKTVNRRSPSPFSAGSRAYTGTVGEHLSEEYEYIFYVKKEDYEKARKLMGQI